MPFFPVFLSVVYVVRNQGARLPAMLSRASELLGKVVADHELIVVDNGSNDDSIAVLKNLTSADGLPNLQVYALTKEVDGDTASWAGLESALGDFVVAIDPLSDDIDYTVEMLNHGTSGADVVFARNQRRAREGLGYRFAYWAFNSFYRSVSGVHLAKEAPKYRLLSRRVINFILRHAQPALTYRHLPATGGFARVNLEYSSEPLNTVPKRLGESFDRGMRLLVSTTRAPMRLVTMLSMFGAAANLLYSIYVVAIGIFKKDVAPGWISLSLQQSGMFFLISLVLLVLGEYILNMASLSNEGPAYHVAEELTSMRMTRREKLNVEDPGASKTGGSRD